MNITVRDALAKDTSLVFQCNFAMKPNITYTVIWYRGDGSVIKTVGDLAEANLAGHYLKQKETDGPGTNIRCAVKIGTTSDVVFVGESSNFFIGIIVLTPVLELQRTGPPTKQVLLRPTVPIRCHYWLPPYTPCTFSVQQQQHSNSETACGGWNMQMAQRCEQSLSLDNWNQTLEFDVSVQDSAGYNKGLDARILKLRVAKSPALNSYWEDYALPDIRIVVTEGSDIWKGKECYVISDPHMKNFDGTLFDFHEDGNFILYKNLKGELEVQVKTRSCLENGGRPYCVCGVAVRAGRDVFLVDFCDSRPVIEVVSCVFTHWYNGECVQVYMVFDNYISRRQDIPSSKDVDVTGGLCGALNGNTDDDFCTGDGVCDIVTDASDEPQKFINSAKVGASDSLFNMDSLEAKISDLLPWASGNASICSCPFAQEDNETAKFAEYDTSMQTSSTAPRRDTTSVTRQVKNVKTNKLQMHNYDIFRAEAT
ncbi:hypothetical protein ScPMuIL_004599 [Solemya velum]